MYDGCGIRPHHRQRFANMQWAAVGLWAVPIIYPVGQVRALLHLIQQQARPNGVDRARLHQDRIAGLDGLVLHPLQDAALLDGPGQRSAVSARPDPGNQLRARCSLQHVPGLRLAKCTGAFQRNRLRVIRMNLQREPVRAVQQLDQQREAFAGARHCLLAQQRLSILCRRLGQGQASWQMLIHNLPALVDHPCLCRRAWAWPQALAAPDVISVDRGQLQEWR